MFFPALSRWVVYDFLLNDEQFPATCKNIFLLFLVLFTERISTTIADMDSTSRTATARTTQVRTNLSSTQATRGSATIVSNTTQ